jgi:hypothetical protein
MNWKLRGLTCLSGAALAAGLFGSGCSAAEAAAEQCGFVCPAEGEGVAAGNASISGVVSVDAFFGSVVRFDAEAKAITEGIQAELDAIAESVGVAKGSGAAAIKAGIEAQLEGKIDGSLTIKAAPPKCEVSARATLEAQAKCDASIDPGSASVKCEGSCKVEASAEASCEGSATLKCEGTAPSLDCQGSCQGSCQLTVAAACEGTCKGTCDGTCTVTNAQGDCEGKCEGNCEGTCELEAGGNCGGSCEGKCTYEPGSAGCSGGAEVKCEAQASGSVDCKGTCEGKVTPPSAKAECEASAKADASVSASCSPPSLTVDFQLDASLQGSANAAARAEFIAWIDELKGHVSAILAYRAKLDGVLEAGGEIGASAEAAIKGSIEAQANGDISASAAFGLGCALAELPVAVGMITASVEGLTTSASASLEVLGSVGLGGS